jgi:hypothetical protein|tara:strand:- start:271 stop:813 length:543 start_codon:yes stop_codon:yes gene_type:complete
MKGLALFEGSWQKVLIKVILLLLVLFVVYSLLKKIRWKKSASETDINNFIQNELPNTTPIDNSSPSDPDTISNSEADLLANNLEIYMKGVGTNTSSLMASVECLNGASLNKVYASFGARDYDGDMLDLFGWFAGELENAPFTSLIYYNECVADCDSYWDQCRETTYMRAIWSKSSIVTTF